MEWIPEQNTVAQHPSFSKTCICEMIWEIHCSLEKYIVLLIDVWLIHTFKGYKQWQRFFFNNSFSKIKHDIKVQKWSPYILV